MSTQQIRVIAICLFRHKNRLLVNPGYDVKKGQPYYRPLGGGVEFGELAINAIQREILEELDQAIEDIKLIGVLENIFTLDGQMGHQIVYVYDARFVDRTLYEVPTILGQEDDGTPFEARWMDLDSFDEYHRLVPAGLLEFFQKE